MYRVLAYRALCFFCWCRHFVTCRRRLCQMAIEKEKFRCSVRVWIMEMCARSWGMVLIRDDRQINGFLPNQILEAVVTPLAIVAHFSALWLSLIHVIPFKLSNQHEVFFKPVPSRYWSIIVHLIISLSINHTQWTPSPASSRNTSCSVAIVVISQDNTKPPIFHNFIPPSPNLSCYTPSTGLNQNIIKFVR